MAGVVQDGRVNLCVGGGGVKPALETPAPVDFDRIHAPRRERVDVLLIVPVGAAGFAAAGGAGVGVDTELEAVGVQGRRQPGDPVRPLLGADHHVAGGVTLALPPASVE